MSNADELIKFKKLLDENVITKEEFEKQKRILLNEDIYTETDINENMEGSDKKEKKGISFGKIFLITIISIMVIGFIITTIVQKNTISNTLIKQFGISEENAKKIENELKISGITYGVITESKELNNIYTENSRAFHIQENGYNCSLLMILKDDKYIYLLEIEEINKETLSDVIIVYENNQVKVDLKEYFKKTTSTTKNNQRFSIISQHGESDSYGFTTITGEIKNNTDRTYSYVQVTFSLYDENGAQIGTAMDNINNLEPNGIWKFKAIGMGSSKGANYKCTGIAGW